MSAQDPRPEDRWPDFIPPDFEQPGGQAPQQPPTEQPPVTGPVLPPPTSRPSAYTDSSAGPRDWAPPSGRQRRRSSGAGDRWFNQPAQPAGYGRSSIFPAPSTPTVVTNVLIGITVVVWMLQNLSPQLSSMLMLIPSIAAEESWRLITSAFAHAPRSLTHVGFNMLTLWLLGRYLEPILGAGRFLAVYLTSALGGSAMFIWLGAWNSAVVGASGAVFGLFGAYMVIGALLRRPLTSVWVLLGLNLVMMFLFPGIAWQAHLGGFLAGAAATTPIAADMVRRGKGKSAVAWPGIGLVVVLIALLIVVRYTVAV